MTYLARIKILPIVEVTANFLGFNAKRGKVKKAYKSKKKNKKYIFCIYNLY
jgi:hypothetical protein